VPSLPSLTTADGVRLAAVHLPRTGPASPHAADLEVAVVVAHGFGGGGARPAVQAVARGLAPHAGVVLPDLRGHGMSGGACTLGDQEVLDVDTAVAAARRLGYRRVVTCGWSMGGSAVLRHAALVGRAVHGHPVAAPVDAVVSVSATSRWFVRDTAPLRRLHWLIECRLGRLTARRLLGVRIAYGSWPVVPESPVEVVGRIAPTPLLLVHGDRDAYFPVEHPLALAAAAGDPSELWLLDGFGHAEKAAGSELLDRIGRHLPVLLSRTPAGRS
jgi:pimeloyl-ACP methyl ester carboxylesterase